MPVELLLVDDSDVYRSTLELLLDREAGLSVVGAVADGEAALQACAEREPDIVLLDFRLPDTDGAALTAALRAARPGLTVVCLTAEASPEERAAVAAAGAAAVIEKGDLAELVLAIRDVAPPP
jgi:DNA-binding NarL/FixJ family response regulator